MSAGCSCCWVLLARATARLLLFYADACTLLCKLVLSYKVRGTSKLVLIAGIAASSGGYATLFCIPDVRFRRLANGAYNYTSCVSIVECCWQMWRVHSCHRAPIRTGPASVRLNFMLRQDQRAPPNKHF